MKKRYVLTAASAAIATAWLVVIPDLSSPRAVARAPAAGLNTEALEMQVRNGLPEFEDRHQRYVGVLDVLRPYPEP